MDNIDTFIEVSCPSMWQSSESESQFLSDSFFFLVIMQPFIISNANPCVEPVRPGCRWGLGGPKERVSSPSHVAGGPHRPPHPSHAQHHPGRWSWNTPSGNETPSSLIYNDTQSAPFFFWSLAVHAAEDTGPGWERSFGGLWVLVNFGRTAHL